ncbi:MAG: zinc-dependent peptidase [Pyrinomonadaceae bacterium]|nr:zinc-dependent peptidase [Phycisphaerales bacterium]
MLGFRRRRRLRIKAQPFPPAWLAIVNKYVPYVQCLSESDKSELYGHIKVFIAEKSFEGCGGLVMTDEIRVTIAAQACVLLLHRDSGYYPDLRTILVYPSSYVAPVKRPLGGNGAIIETAELRAGESWHRGSLVLSWRDVQAGSAQPCDGRNVVFHEFAHQLDSESGAVEGAPALEGRSAYAAWATVLGREFQSLMQDLRTNRPTLMGGYAAKNPAEFFAVVTEVFFERPQELKGRHPELYEQFRQFYKQDPATWMGTCERAAAG